MNIPEKIILNNPLNWILSWNEWITQFLNRYLPFLMISPLFCLFWTLFGQFLGIFPIRPVLIIPWLLNWIIFWIESPEFILNWIIFWIESWVKQYWIEYWMNHFLAKFKYWIESDWVSFTTSTWSRSLCWAHRKSTPSPPCSCCCSPQRWSVLSWSTQTWEKNSHDNQMHCNYTSVYYRVTYPLERIHEWALMTLPWHEKLKSPVASLFMCSSPMCEQRWSLAKFILMLE